MSCGISSPRIIDAAMRDIASDVMMPIPSCPASQKKPSHLVQTPRQGIYLLYYFEDQPIFAQHVAMSVNS